MTKKHTKSRCLRERRAVTCEAREKTRSPFMSRSGQAALEFLMTYGWAILVVLVAVGALAYFGVLSPDKFLPAKCTLTSGIGCIDHRVQAAAGAGGFGLVTIVITNSLGYDINTVKVGAGGCGDSVANCNGGAANCPTTLTNGQQQTYILLCTAALAGSKYNAQLNVSYITTDTGIAHNNQGQIVTKIE